jgi:6-pyruvoyltetrahydropterin/6-carboxytetrahydropterin synthase
MSTVFLTKRIEFAASHRYHNPCWDAATNRRVFGACHNEHGHGHNYLLEVTIGGEVDPATGMVVNLYDLKQALEDVLTEFDHKHLNLDTPYFSRLIPTTENIAHVLWDILSRHPEIGELKKIALYEDEDLSAEITTGEMKDVPRAAVLIRRYRVSAGGHDYLLSVAVRGVPDPQTGMVTDIAALDRIVTEQVLDRFDGQDVARDPVLAGQPATGPVLARSAWRLLSPAIPQGQLDRIVLTMGGGEAFEYRGGEAQDRSR